ncbi:MAG: hypothetical protein MHM6MM_001319, partial [Cercozoa sp. M6MM]
MHVATQAQRAGKAESEHDYARASSLWLEVGVTLKAHVNTYSKLEPWMTLAYTEAARLLMLAAGCAQGRDASQHMAQAVDAANIAQQHCPQNIQAALVKAEVNQLVDNRLDLAFLAASQARENAKLALDLSQTCPTGPLEELPQENVFAAALQSPSPQLQTSSFAAFSRRPQHYRRVSDDDEMEQATDESDNEEGLVIPVLDEERLKLLKRFGIRGEAPVREASECMRRARKLMEGLCDQIVQRVPVLQQDMALAKVRRLRLLARVDLIDLDKDIVVCDMRDQGDGSPPRLLQQHYSFTDVQGRTRYNDLCEIYRALIAHMRRELQQLHELRRLLSPKLTQSLTLPKIPEALHKWCETEQLELDACVAQMALQASRMAATLRHFDDALEFASQARVEDAARVSTAVSTTSGRVFSTDKLLQLAEIAVLRGDAEGALHKYRAAILSAQPDLLTLHELKHGRPAPHSIDARTASANLAELRHFSAYGDRPCERAQSQGACDLCQHEIILMLCEQLHSDLAVTVQVCQRAGLRATPQVDAHALLEAAVSFPSGNKDLRGELSTLLSLGAHMHHWERFDGAALLLRAAMRRVLSLDRSAGGTPRVPTTSSVFSGDSRHERGNFFSVAMLLAQALLMSGRVAASIQWCHRGLARVVRHISASGRTHELRWASDVDTVLSDGDRALPDERGSDACADIAGSALFCEAALDLPCARYTAGVRRALACVHEERENNTGAQESKLSEYFFIESFAQIKALRAHFGLFPARRVQSPQLSLKQLARKVSRITFWIGDAATCFDVMQRTCMLQMLQWLLEVIDRAIAPQDGVATQSTDCDGVDQVRRARHGVLVMADYLRQALLLQRLHDNLFRVSARSDVPHDDALWSLMFARAARYCTAVLRESLPRWTGAQDALVRRVFADEYDGMFKRQQRMDRLQHAQIMSKKARKGRGKKARRQRRHRADEEEEAQVQVSARDMLFEMSALSSVLIEVDERRDVLRGVLESAHMSFSSYAPCDTIETDMLFECERSDDSGLGTLLLSETGGTCDDGKEELVLAQAVRDADLALPPAERTASLICLLPDQDRHRLAVLLRAVCSRLRETWQHLLQSRDYSAHATSVGLSARKYELRLLRILAQTEVYCERAKIVLSTWAQSDRARAEGLSPAMLQSLQQQVGVPSEHMSVPSPSNAIARPLSPFTAMRVGSRFYSPTTRARLLLTSAESGDELSHLLNTASGSSGVPSSYSMSLSSMRAFDDDMPPSLAAVPTLVKEYVELLSVIMRRPHADEAVREYDEDARVALGMARDLRNHPLTAWVKAKCKPRAHTHVLPSAPPPPPPDTEDGATGGIINAITESKDAHVLGARVLGASVDTQQPVQPAQTRRLLHDAVNFVFASDLLGSDAADAETPDLSTDALHELGLAPLCVPIEVTSSMTGEEVAAQVAKGERRARQLVQTRAEWDEALEQFGVAMTLLRLEWPRVRTALRDALVSAKDVASITRLPGLFLDFLTYKYSKTDAMQSKHGRQDDRPEQERRVRVCTLCLDTIVFLSERLVDSKDFSSQPNVRKKLASCVVTLLRRVTLLEPVLQQLLRAGLSLLTCTLPAPLLEILEIGGNWSRKLAARECASVTKLRALVGRATAGDQDDEEQEWRVSMRASSRTGAAAHRVLALLNSTLALIRLTSEAHADARNATSQQRPLLEDRWTSEFPRLGPLSADTLHRWYTEARRYTRQQTTLFVNEAAMLPLVHEALLVRALLLDQFAVAHVVPDTYDGLRSLPTLAQLLWHSDSAASSGEIELPDLPTADSKATEQADLLCSQWQRQIEEARGFVRSDVAVLASYLDRCLQKSHGQAAHEFFVSPVSLMLLQARMHFQHDSRAAALRALRRAQQAAEVVARLDNNNDSNNSRAAQASRPRFRQSRYSRPRASPRAEAPPSDGLKLIKAARDFLDSCRTQEEPLADVTRLDTSLRASSTRSGGSFHLGSSLGGSGSGDSLDFSAAGSDAVSDIFGSRLSLDSGRSGGHSASGHSGGHSDDETARELRLQGYEPIRDRDEDEDEDEQEDASFHEVTSTVSHVVSLIGKVHGALRAIDQGPRGRSMLTSQQRQCVMRLALRVRTVVDSEVSGSAQRYGGASVLHKVRQLPPSDAPLCELPQSARLTQVMRDLLLSLSVLPPMESVPTYEESGLHHPGEAFKRQLRRGLKRVSLLSEAGRAAAWSRVSAQCRHGLHGMVRALSSLADGELVADDVAWNACCALTEDELLQLCGVSRRSSRETPTQARVGGGKVFPSVASTGTVTDSLVSRGASSRALDLAASASGDSDRALHDELDMHHRHYLQQICGIQSAAERSTVQVAYSRPSMSSNGGSGSIMLASTAVMLLRHIDDLLRKMDRCVQATVYSHGAQSVRGIHPERPTVLSDKAKCLIDLGRFLEASECIETARHDICALDNSFGSASLLSVSMQSPRRSYLEIRRRLDELQVELQKQQLQWKREHFLKQRRMTQLHLAVLHQQEDRLRELLKVSRRNRRMEVERPDNARNTALHYACMLGNDKMVEMLIDAGAYRILRMAAGFKTPLMCAIQARSVEVVRRLLRTEHDLRTEHAGGDLYAHPHEAAHSHSQSHASEDEVVFNPLLHGEARELQQALSEPLGPPSWDSNAVHVSDDQDNLPLRQCCETRQMPTRMSEAVAIARLLLDAGADPLRYSESERWLALHAALESSNRPLALLLLDAVDCGLRRGRWTQQHVRHALGVTTSQYHETVLHVAVQKRFLGVIKRLVALAPALVNVQDHVGNTALHHALSYKGGVPTLFDWHNPHRTEVLLEIVSVLVANGADLTLRTKESTKEGSKEGRRPLQEFDEIDDACNLSGSVLVKRDTLGYRRLRDTIKEAQAQWKQRQKNRKKR